MSYVVSGCTRSFVLGMDSPLTPTLASFTMEDLDTIGSMTVVVRACSHCVIEVVGYSCGFDYDVRSV